jgi:chlorite dismutase
MTNVAQWQPARLPSPRIVGQGNPAEGVRQFVRFAFSKLDPAWLRLDAATRLADAQELATVIEEQRDRLLVHSYTTFGLHAETDFLLWCVARHLDDFEAMAVAIRRTRMGSWLQTPYSYLGMTGVLPNRQETRDDTVISGGRHLLVFPFVRTAAWDTLPEEERREVTRELVRLGSETPGAGWDTTYSVGLDSHDGILAFEADRPESLLDMIESLRKTQSSLYTKRDTPIFTCTRQDPITILARIGGV